MKRGLLYKERIYSEERSTLKRKGIATLLKRGLF